MAHSLRPQSLIPDFPTGSELLPSCSVLAALQHHLHRHRRSLSMFVSLFLSTLFLLQFSVCFLEKPVFIRVFNTCNRKQDIPIPTVLIYHIFRTACEVILSTLIQVHSHILFFLFFLPQFSNHLSNKLQKWFYYVRLPVFAFFVLVMFGCLSETIHFLE